MPKIFAAVCAASFFVSAAAQETPSQTKDGTPPAAVEPQVGAAKSSQEPPEGSTVRAAADAAAGRDAAPAKFDGSKYRKARALGGREPLDEHGTAVPRR